MRSTVFLSACRATPTILAQYAASIFGSGDTTNAPDPSVAPSSAATDSTADTDDDSGSSAEPATTLSRLFWHGLIAGDATASQYVFDTRPLTNWRPYFAAYEKFADLPRTLDRLDLFQDDWGYLLLWATLGVAAICAGVLILIPVAIGWRRVFARSPGKVGTIIYFAALGLGYITVEVGLISRFTLALSNPTISASVLARCMPRSCVRRTLMLTFCRLTRRPPKPRPVLRPYWSALTSRP